MIKKTIYLNSGHSNTDPGAISQYGVESDINISIRDELIPMLERNGFEVQAVPDNLNLAQSISWVNEHTSNINDGLALSIHCNCCNREGVETYYYNHNTQSKNIAQKLLDGFCEMTPIKKLKPRSDTVTRFHELGWIRRTNIWATLIECGFMDSSVDMEKIIEHFDTMAKGICNGVCKIFGVQYVEESSQDDIPGREKIKAQIIKLVNKL